MRSHPSLRRLITCAILAAVSSVASAADAPLDAAAVLKWKDGKKAVFLLQFDDSVPTDITQAVPELQKRGMVGTFYINAGGQAFKTYRQQWETTVPKAGMVLANHTFTHKGVKSATELEAELSQCNDAIAICYPALKSPRLISFGQPGGVPWQVSKEEFEAALTQHHLVNRLPYKGYPISMKTEAEVLALVDHALATGEMEYHVFHGVGGDWLVTPMEIFTALLDKLDANRAQLWITDPISWHQYVTERTTAAVKTVEANSTQLRLRLTCSADPAFYDLPLTLRVIVPSAWKQCEIRQSGREAKATANNGSLQFDAVPGADEIIITPMAK